MLFCAPVIMLPIAGRDHDAFGRQRGESKMWLAVFADGVLDGALKGALKGAIIGGVAGALIGVVFLVKRVLEKKKKADDRSSEDEKI